MKSEIILDKAKLTKIKTRDGFVRASAAITRSGIIEYLDYELGVGDAGKTVLVLRTDQTVFDPKTISSVRGAAITIGHPDGGITPENYKKLSVGNISGEPSKIDGNRLGADVMIGDKDAIALIESGSNELSIGYQFDFEPAENKDYDYESVGALDINHVALVKRGRAGSKVRIFDSRSTIENENKPENTDMTDAELQAKIERLIADKLPDGKANQAEYDAAKIAAGVVDGLKPIIKQITDMADAVKAADDKVKADEAKAKSKAATDKFEKTIRAEERTRALTLADALPMIPADKRDAAANADIKDVLIMAIGDSKKIPEGASLDYLQGVFEMIKDTRNRALNDYQVTTDQRTNLTDVEKSRNEMISQMQNSWKGEK